MNALLTQFYQWRDRLEQDGEQLTLTELTELYRENNWVQVKINERIQQKLIAHETDCAARLYRQRRKL